MTWSAAGSDRAFKRALIVSAAGHVILFSFVILNPSLPRSLAQGRHPLHFDGDGGRGGHEEEAATDGSPAAETKPRGERRRSAKASRNPSAT